MKLNYFRWLLTGAVFFISTAYAIDLSYSNSNPMGEGTVTTNSLVIKGNIEYGDYDKLLNFLRKNPQPFVNNRFIVLASNGGDIEEALKISEFIKKSYPSVFIGQTYGQCLSACFFLAAAAPQRLWTEGYLGIHRPYINFQLHNKLSIIEIQKIEKNVMEFARNYLNELEVSSFLIDKMFSTSSAETYFVKRNELTEYSFFFEQLMIARCGYDVNDLKIARIKNLSTENPELFNKSANRIGQAIRCGKLNLNEEATKYLTRLKIN